MYYRFLAIIFIFNITNAHALDFVLGSGFAGAQNFDFPEYYVEYGLQIKHGPKAFSRVTMLDWSGADGGYERRSPNSPIHTEFFYSSKALNFELYYLPVKTEKFELLLGGGMGAYERILVQQAGPEQKIYTPALSLGAILNYQLFDSLSVYSKLYGNMIQTQRLIEYPTMIFFGLGVTYSY